MLKNNRSYYVWHSLLFMLLIAASTGSSVASSMLPGGCVVADITFTDDEIILGSKQEKQTKQAKPSLFLLTNIAKVPVFIDHLKDDPGASGGWAQTLQPGLWSAIVLDKAAFHLHCLEVKPGSAQYVPCKTAVLACQFSKARFKDAESGSYWLTDNKEMPDLLDEIVERGIKRK